MLIDEFDRQVENLIAKGYGYLTYAFIVLLIIPVLTIRLWRLLRS